MPQINQLLLVYQSQWFWLLLTLAVIYFGIGKTMLPKIAAVVDSRNARIQGDLSAAAKARDAADAADAKARAADLGAREQAQTLATKAKADAAKHAEGVLAQADVVIAQKLAAAEANLAAARAAALDSLELVASEAAQDIVAKVSGAHVSAAEAASAVKAVLAHG